MYTSEDYAQKAAALWQRFTPNEQSLVAIGVFPANAMNVAEDEGYETHSLAVALMDHRASMKGRRDAGS